MTSTDSTSDQLHSGRRHRSAITALAIISPAPTIGAAVYLWIAPGIVGWIVFIAAKVVLYGLPICWSLLVDRQRPRLLKKSTRGLLFGLLSGIGISAVIWIAWILVFQSMIDPRK